MNTYLFAALLLVLLGLAYQVGWSRSRRLVDGAEKVHSRSQYHGALVAIWALAPALAIFALWALFGDTITQSYIQGLLPPDVVSEGGAPLVEATQRLRSVASGFGVAGDLRPYELAAGESLRSFQFITTLIVLAAAAISSSSNQQRR